MSPAMGGLLTAVGARAQHSSPTVNRSGLGSAYSVRYDDMSWRLDAALAARPMLCDQPGEDGANHARRVKRVVKRVVKV